MDEQRHKIHTQFQSTVEETSKSGDGQLGGVESPGTSAQAEGLRRRFKKVTSMPRPKRLTGANRENREGKRNSMCKGPMVGKGFWA